MSVTDITVAPDVSHCHHYARGMSRWEPDARGRLEQAALALYRERGFERVTVAEIAARAGLTERTFFRHYADKREVLFAESGTLQDVLVCAVTEAPDASAPIDVVVAALAAVGARLGERRDRARRRQAIIDANPELQERELIKLATFATAIAGALRERGVSEPAASLAGQTGIVVFRVAFDRWVTGTGRRGLPELIRESFDQLKALTA